MPGYVSPDYMDEVAHWDVEISQSKSGLLIVLF